MFRLIRELFGVESLIDQSFQETVEVLGIARDMTDAAGRSLRASDSAKVAMDVRSADKRINKFEREVRRNIITHLSVSGPIDVAAALGLTSIIIDVERIGDYAKNIVELAQAHPQRLDAGPYEEQLQRLEARVREGFDEVRRALEASDEEAARRYMSAHKEYAELADAMVTALISSEDHLEKGRAVALALYARYLKRTESHLFNIVSSVANPFPRIGFRNKSGQDTKSRS